VAPDYTPMFAGSGYHPARDLALVLDELDAFCCAVR
jgi:hypothetical protein